MAPLPRPTLWSKVGGSAAVASLPIPRPVARPVVSGTPAVADGLDSEPWLEGSRQGRPLGQGMRGRKEAY
ncbi:hypothetical protein CLOM_g6560 [Closterium sp. NIES-68]|nr:hypothetical protein CLOM_g6560 [Closterium sp. NIES-68]GJP75714.1 hypothetical protein CLOP_g6123 [Closterium sp. NIES-67]